MREIQLPASSMLMKEYIGSAGYLELLQIEWRLKDASPDDQNLIAKLLMKRAYLAIELGIHQSIAFSDCQKILSMHDHGHKIWPGIIHRAIKIILIHKPKIEAEEIIKLLERGQANATLMGEKYEKDMLGAFVFASRRMEKFSYNTQLNIY